MSTDFANSPADVIDIGAVASGNGPPAPVRTDGHVLALLGQPAEIWLKLGWAIARYDQRREEAKEKLETEDPEEVLMASVSELVSGEPDDPPVVHVASSTQARADEQLIAEFDEAAAALSDLDAAEETDDTRLARSFFSVSRDSAVTFATKVPKIRRLVDIADEKFQSLHKNVSNAAMNRIGRQYFMRLAGKVLATAGFSVGNYTAMTAWDPYVLFFGSVIDAVAANVSPVVVKLVITTILTIIAYGITWWVITSTSRKAQRDAQESFDQAQQHACGFLESLIKQGCITPDTVWNVLRNATDDSEKTNTYERIASHEISALKAEILSSLTH